MRRSFDTVYARIALISVAILFAMQAAWFAAMWVHRPRLELEGYAHGLALVLDAADRDAAQGAALAGALRVHLVPEWNMPRGMHWQAAEESALGELVQHLRPRLPAHTALRVDDTAQHRLWVRFPGRHFWVVFLNDLPRPPPLLPEAIAMLCAALLLSLIAAWQMHRPLRSVAQAAGAFGADQPLAPLPLRGPRELRDLTRAFNQMMQRVQHAEAEKTLMLAGVAHDLKSPLTRMKLRADVLDDEAERRAFLVEIDSLTHIVEQFLDFGRGDTRLGEPIAVESYLRSQFASAAGDSDSLFVLSLTAGKDFRLPRVALDRLVGNLVDNALDHGEPPVEIVTACETSRWLIEIRDRGSGIPAEQLAEALKPFVRLDPARSGDGHCGLGLAIVAQLAMRLGGQCAIRNARRGGLAVRLTFPMSSSGTAGAASPHRSVFSDGPV